MTEVTPDGIVNSHIASKHDLWQLPPIDSNFNDHIFNTDESENEEDAGSGIYNNSFSLASLSSPLVPRDSPLSSPRLLASPVGDEGDTLPLNLPSLTFSTPKHEFSRQFSLPHESPTEFEKFTSVIDMGSPHGSLPEFLSPPRTDIDDLDLRDLLSTKSLPPSSPAPRTPLSIENLLEIDPRSSADQLQDIIETAVNTKPSPSITEVPNSPAPLDPKSVLFDRRASSSEVTIPPSSGTFPKSPLTDSLKPPSPSMNRPTKPQAPFSGKNASDIVSHLDDLISSNESKVQLSAIPKSAEPPVIPKRQKPKKPNFVRPDPNKVRPIAKKTDRPIDPRLVTRKPPDKVTPSTTSSTLENLASSLGIVQPAEPTSQNTIPLSNTPKNMSLDSNPTIQAVNSAKSATHKAPTQPMVVGKAAAPKPGQRFLNKPVIISQIPPQAVIKSNPIIKSTKIVSASVKPYPSASSTPSVQTYTPPPKTQVATTSSLKSPPTVSNKHSIVPYKAPIQPTSSDSNKYVLLPLEKLKNASPAVLSQLGLDKALPSSAKRPVTVETGPAKRVKPDPAEPESSFTERTSFPINIKLPNSTKERLGGEYHGSIPEMMEKARAKRKSNLSNMSTFTQMENFINEFIQQNNDQVMEILFLKKNNKEINSKFNHLAKMFHMKNEEHKKLKEEVKQISAQNKKMEKELKMIKDVIKKYMTS